jgi:hypothetical protein
MSEGTHVAAASAELPRVADRAETLHGAWAWAAVVGGGREHRRAWGKRRPAGRRPLFLLLGQVLKSLAAAAWLAAPAACWLAVWLSQSDVSVQPTTHIRTYSYACTAFG